MSGRTLDLPDLGEGWARRDSDPGWPSSSVTRFRDLLLTRTDGLVTVIACDSNAGIGDRPADVIRQPARDTGFGAAKVPLMEVLSSGATPIILVNNLSCALSGGGEEIVAGIRDCIELSGHRVVVTGSDETNVPTVQTGVGITVIGVASPDQLLLGGARAGDSVIVVGTPMDGIAVPYAETDPEVVTPREVAAIVRSGVANEILPVGSRGVAYEAGELARTAGLRLDLHPTDVDLRLSAGSSTCILVACPSDDLPRLAELVPQSLTVVGELTAPS